MKIAQRLLWPLGIGLSLWFAAINLVEMGAASKAQPAPVAGAALNRPQDPVIVAGTNLSAYVDAPVNELVLYTQQAGGWAPIPFQIDERANDITGTYVTSDGGLLDANDELVFMAADAGDRAINNSDWPNDAASKAYPRYAILINDPLTPGSEAWAYLYRSPTLPRSNISYLTWNQAAQIVTATSYIAAFKPANFLGLADLKLNGNPADILDRQKIRVKPPFFPALTEENLISFIPPTINFSVVGPVRAIRNDSALNLALYGARFDFHTSVNSSMLGVTPQFIRNSLDLNPVMNGATYFDSNATVATINGVTDTVPASPRIDWYQVISNTSLGGFVLTVSGINAGGGTVSNYYKDNSLTDSSDTGDQKSFGDAGLRIDSPGQVIQLSVAAYVLPSTTTTNVGAIYFNRISNPVGATTILQRFGFNFDTYLPIILRN